MADHLELQPDDGVPAGAPIVAARITMVLNAGRFPDGRPLEGPDVDLACATWEGNPAGDVDAWERGDAQPSREQAAALAALARVPLALLYEPITAAERAAVGFICVRGRGGAKTGLRRGCYRIDGVPAPPAGPPPHQQGRLF